MDRIELYKNKRINDLKETIEETKNMDARELSRIIVNIEMDRCLWCGEDRDSCDKMCITNIEKHLKGEAKPWELL